MVETSMSIIGMVMGVEMIKAAQQQDKLALKLIQNSVSGSEKATAPTQVEPTQTAQPVTDGSRIDIYI